MKKFLPLALVLSLCTLHLPSALSQQVLYYRHTPRFCLKDYNYSNPETNWIDSVMETMNLEQRIAQLFVARVPLDMNDRQVEEFSNSINSYGVGGVCFFAGTAERQASITRRLHRQARVPLLVSIDGEWGLGMRLKDMYSFPRNARFGRLSQSDDSIVYRMGAEIGRQCRMMGIHINFAPVADINSNPKNPVIGTRSYGVDKVRVAQLASMFALGQQSQGVLAVAKHFPGHGDTETDSHLELPLINHSRAYIDSVDLYPFQKLIEAGVGGVMIAHLQVNAIDSKTPSSLSRHIVTDLLKDKLGFKGLVITDGIDMKGVTNTYKDGQAELAALRAGNDLILLPPDIPQSIKVIKHAAKKDELLRKEIDEHCRKVLSFKYRYVLPRINDSIQVPGDDRRLACDSIVADLEWALDHRIDSIVNEAIRAKAMPGCQVLALHKGRVLFDRAYGHLTYGADADLVTPETLYDLASVTKVCATTLAVMRLVDMEKLKINDRLCKYLPYLSGTDKETLTIKQVMSHCARLKAFDAYWKQTSDRDSLLALVAASPLNDKEGYCYSDLGFILLSDLVLRVTGQPLDQFVAEQFYRPMGLSRTSFNPLANGMSPSLIAPTERDSLRNDFQGCIRGHVHDPNAFAMGGVSGHAGLFSNASEVASLMQMLLNGGIYQGRRYLKEETVDLFTRRHYETAGNRRALGFDKPPIKASKNAQVCPEASQASFGHTGFTGTMVWVDPSCDLVFVFLSNRVHPDASTNLLARMNVRTQIQSILYDLIKKR